jgi:RNA polymerase sigma-70 factor (ECF subfamily)
LKSIFKNNAKESDEALLKNYRDTLDITVLGVLFDRYLSLLYGVCLKYFRNVPDAKDGVMQIVESLPEKIVQQEIRNFKSWLYVVCKNYCLMELRKISKNKNVVFQESFMEYTDEFHLDVIMEDERRLQVLNACIGLLPPHQSKAIKLFFMQDLSYKEISDATGNDVTKVKSFIQNAKRNLKICLENKNIK